ncbi:hypothetical protein AYI70_g1469 [Smittium culicis]|uniref:Uncharacterized protein n=1 Tax=Smittium culicis TaxID=133412 RepID=A0A1R1YCS5_9FUNG|nr:hypothetical protein AYI70_g1469 [Smittium culicis]
MKIISNQLIFNDFKKLWNFIKSYTDTTGNSRSTDEWKNLISSDCDYYPECDSTILWSDITQAVADTPNNKAPGADVPRNISGGPVA